MSWIFTVLCAALGVWLASACGSDGSQPASERPPESVVLESISPSSGPLGTEVTLQGSGFTAASNDVAFRNPKIDFQGRDTAYLNGLSSPDGKTLRFRQPDNESVLLGACAFSQLKTNEACPAIGILLPTGDSEIFVVNENGTSNSVTFAVSGPDAAQSVPVEQTIDEIYAQMARDNPGFAGLYLDPDGKTLHVLVKTSASPAETAAVERAVRSHLARYDGPQPDKIEIDPAKYDFAELKEWYDRMGPVVWAVPGLVFTDIDEVKNGLRIGVETAEARELVEQRLAELGIPNELVEIEISPPVVDDIGSTEGSIE